VSCLHQKLWCISQTPGRVHRRLITDVCGSGARGHPPAETIRVLATLRRFLREGMLWRSLTATAVQASGSTLRRWPTRWARNGILAQVHAVLVGEVL
jgi:hypothetical protein